MNYWLILQICGYFLAALILTALITPPIIKRAISWKILDTPNGRKVHKYSKPRVGGLAMFCIFFILVLTIDIYSPFIRGVIVGSTLITFFGFLDDLLGIRALPKLLFQLMVAFITASPFFGFDIQINSLTVLSQVTIPLGFLSVPITMIWIVGVMNAINLIDGLDGLAAGISAIAAFTFCVAAFAFGHIDTGLMLAVLLGVTLGFLRYNFNPARLFMGDSGSYFLGYNLAVLSVIGIWNHEGVFSFAIPVLVLGIPFYDVLTSILRRLKNKKPIFSADGQHIHHRIMAIGFTHKQTVIVIYLESLFLAVSSGSLILIKNNAAILVFALIVFLIHFSFVYLKNHYKEQ